MIFIRIFTLVGVSELMIFGAAAMAYFVLCAAPKVESYDPDRSRADSGRGVGSCKPDW